MEENKLYLTAVRDFVAGVSKPRSPQWPKVEKAHLEVQPVCACCGSKVHLNVHHIMPFHLHPELELDPTNLITLCMDPARECHLKIGHGDNFVDYNPNVIEDVAKLKSNMALFESVAEEAKTNRLAQ